MSYKRVSPVPVSEGGTGAVTITGVLIGNGTSAVSGNAVTQYNTLVGGASNAISSVAPSATSGIPLVSGGSSANPSYTTAVVAGGGTGVTTMTTAYAPVCAGTTATGALQVASTGIGTSGFVLTSTGASSLPSFQAIPASGFTWVNVTGPTQAMSANTGYVVTNTGSSTTLTLPASPTIGDTYRVAGGINLGGAVTIAQNSTDRIHFSPYDTTTGVGGSLSLDTYGAIELICVNTTTFHDFTVISSVGNITVV